MKRTVEVSVSVRLGGFPDRHLGRLVAVPVALPRDPRDALGQLGGVRSVQVPTVQVAVVAVGVPEGYNGQ